MDSFMPEIEQKISQAAEEGLWEISVDLESMCRNAHNSEYAEKYFVKK